MKLNAPCTTPGCGGMLVAMPVPKQQGHGYQATCSKCQKRVVVVWELPHYFYRELMLYANSHLYEQEYRAAVIEAHTALDVFVRTWAQDALRSLGTPDTVVDHILKAKRTKPLIDMVKALYPSIGFTKPPEAIFTVRNDVVHKGKKPRHEEAQAVIYCVGRWIDETMKLTAPVFTITPDITT